MTLPRYDAHVQFYVEFVDRALADPSSFWHPLLACYDSLLEDKLPGARVLDIACGEGHLARRLAAFGPQEVVGIDLSSELLKVASARTHSARISFRLDDAQRLETVDSGAVDIAVSNLAVMDIPDHRALFGAVRRVLSANGVFVFSLLHPCFEVPFHLPDAPQYLTDETGTPIAFLIHGYNREGHWRSGGDGVRGRVGAYHRTLSTLVNDLLSAGFALQSLHEPVPEISGLYGQVPRVLVIEGRAA
jgi:SAM-dependent methyltransferase